ncbi:MAG: DNA-binding protein [Comamonas sp.]
MALKKRSEVRAEFIRKGWSISAWATRNGYSPNLVIAIINDDDVKPVRKCTRGDSHNIAVLLGLKEGEVSRPPHFGRLAAAA